MEAQSQIAFGGGCHWCTEAVFQSLIGVKNVEQGYVASNYANSSYSEAVVVYFNATIISLSTLIEIHLHTHKSTVNHSMRCKYRSAVYTFSEDQENTCKTILEDFDRQFTTKLITKVLPFITFKPSRAQIQNYYYNNTSKPFCERFIKPKLQMLLRNYSKNTNLIKLKHLQNES